MRYLILTTALVLSICSTGQVPTVLEQKHNTVLIINGKAHIGNGEVVEKSAIGIEEGKIKFVKNALTADIVETEWDTIIDVEGKHVYPGFIAPNVTLGITEIDAVRASRDFNEAGDINPNVRSLIAYNTDSKVVYTVRTNGVLVTQSTPRGGLISGSSSVMALDGWNWEDAVYKADDGVHINWPRKYRTTGWWAEPGTTTKNKNYLSVKQNLYAFFEKALAYSRIRKPEKRDLKLDAMRAVFKGDKRVFLHADFVAEINDIIDFSRHFNLKNPVIVGGYDAYYLADRLKENHFSVMLGRPHSLPKFAGDPTNTWYTLPSKLQTAGVLFCIQNEGDMEAMNVRNLPFLAGTAWAYGLSEEEAVASISLNAAQILGVDDKIGSLEEGKDATLFVSEGNALDMMTNKGYMAMVKGNFLILDNHQMQLYRKYCVKYGIEPQ